jgi:hypothetical protein
MENLSLLGSLSTHLHQEFVRVYYLTLPVFFENCSTRLGLRS